MKPPLAAPQRFAVHGHPVHGDAIERRRVRSHLRSLAYYDSLTGLPNRVLLLERLAEALTARPRPGLMEDPHVAE